MRSFWSFSLQRQLAVAIGLLLVPVLAAAVWSGMSTFRERATELGDQAHILAHTTAAYINRDLAYLDSTGEGLQSNPDVQALNPALSEDLFRRVTAGHPNVACIDLVRRSGDIVARTIGSPGCDLKDPVSGWSEQIVRSGQRSVSPLYTTASGVHYVVVGYPVRDDAHEIVGAIGFFIDLKTIQDSLGALPIPVGSVVTIADRDGRVLARSHESERYVGQLLPVDMRPARDIAGPVERTDIDGVRVCTAKRGWRTGRGW